MTPHIESKKEEIAPIVLMPGDPLRAKYIAENFLENVTLVNHVRNMFAYTGTYKGKKVTVFPSGMGIPSMGIYSYELFKFYDVKKIIRIGTCGSFHEDIKCLDVVLAEKAYSKTYFDKLLDDGNDNLVEASADLNRMIMNSAKKNNIDLKIGEIITSDVFDLYCDDKEKYRSNYPKRDFIAVEMEAYALFYVARKLKKDAACLLTVVDSLFDSQNLTIEQREKSLNDMIKVALESLLD